MTQKTTREDKKKGSTPSSSPDKAQSKENPKKPTTISSGKTAGIHSARTPKTTTSSKKQAKKPKGSPRKKPSKKKPPGQPEKYDKNTFPLLAQDYARQGLIDTQIAAKLEISPAVLYRYKNKYREFREAIKAGKRPVDVEVKNALLKRALGFEYEETKAEYIPGMENDKGEAGEAIVTKITKTTKVVLADVTADKFWLINRCPDEFREKTEVDVKGSVGTHRLVPDWAAPDALKKKKKKPKKPAKPPASTRGMKPKK